METMMSVRYFFSVIGEFMCDPETIVEVFSDHILYLSARFNETH